MAVVAQMGAAFGVFLKAKKMETKNVSLSAGITGIFGITEPAIYGVTLKYKKPFICGCVGGAIGAAVMSFFHSAYYAYAGLPGPLTVVNAISKDAPMSFTGELIGCAVAAVIAIVLIQVIGFDDPASDDTEVTDEKTITEEVNEMVVNGAIVKNVMSPLSGEVVSLSEVKDEVFSSEAMGKGCAVIPSEGKVYAPFDGTIVGLLESHHAVGLESKNGIEVLIHVGMDTVKLNGKHFTCHVEQDQKVAKGQLLLEFDIEAIKKEGYEIITPVIITNSDEFTDVETEVSGKVNQGDLLLNLR